MAKAASARPQGSGCPRVQGRERLGLRPGRALRGHAKARVPEGSREQGAVGGLEVLGSGNFQLFR